MPSSRPSPDAACAALATTQFGVITSEQLRGCGLSDDAVGRRVAGGLLIRMLPGVFRMAAAPRSWHQRAMAGSFWAGPGGGIGGEAAAALHALDGFPLPHRIEVATTRCLRPPHHLIVVRRRSCLPSSDLTTQAGIPVTTCMRTLIDVAGYVSEERLELALEDARRRRLVRADALEARLEQMATNTRGRGSLMKLLGIQSGRATDSGLEVKVLRMLRKAGFPEPVRQEVLDDDGRFVGRVDLAYPHRRLIVEVDGFRWHSGRGRFDSDRLRRNGMTSMGWLVLHVTSEIMRTRRDDFLRDFRRGYERRL